MYFLVVRACVNDFFRSILFKSKDSYFVRTYFIFFCLGILFFLTRYFFGNILIIKEISNIGLIIFSTISFLIILNSTFIGLDDDFILCNVLKKTYWSSKNVSNFFLSRIKEDDKHFWYNGLSRSEARIFLRDKVRPAHNCGINAFYRIKNFIYETKNFEKDKKHFDESYKMYGLTLSNGNGLIVEQRSSVNLPTAIFASKENAFYGHKYCARLETISQDNEYWHKLNLFIDPRFIFPNFIIFEI